MKVYVNQGYIKRRASVGKYASLLGLVVLGGGLIISLRNPKLFYISFGTLILGFVLSNVGIYYANRYVRPDRPDAALTQALKGFDKRFALYQYLLPVSHVLHEPGGLTIFVPKPQEGLTSYDAGKWHNKQGWSRIIRWVGQEGLGKPELELEKEVQTLENWLHKQAPDLQVPVRGVAVFTHTNAELQLKDPPVTALHAKQLKSWLRKAGRLPPLPKETSDRLTQLLDQVVQVDATEVDD